MNELDSGEAAAIALALEFSEVELIIDEKIGRKIARAHGIEIFGLIGVILEAKACGLIQAIKPLLDQLRQEANFRISERLYEQVLRQADEG